MSALVTYSRMIKLSHSIFALPFALASGLLAQRHLPAPVPWTTWLLIVLCMVTARSSAMGFNRIVDRGWDGQNPRTADRELVTGAISLGAAWGFTLGSAALFVLFSGLLGLATLWLSPVAIAVVWGYSLTKRFTMLCHAVLGLALGLAPTAVWIALTGGVDVTPILLSVAVASWVGGFDIIYACQDAAFDASVGLHSIPARLGLRRALWISAAVHVVTVGCLVAVARFEPVGLAYGLGVALITAVLAYEHWLVRPDDLTKVDKAFFDLNGYISLAFLLAVALS